jgi:hypothetical protein
LPVTSPQQLSGAPPAIADDVYGFGALLYELISGAPLFAPDALPEQVRAEIPPALAATALAGSVPAALDELVAAMLRKQAARRPQTMDAVRTALASILAAAAA